MDLNFTFGFDWLPVVFLTLVSLCAIGCKWFSFQTRAYLSHHPFADAFYDALMWIPLFVVVNEYISIWMAFAIIVVLSIVFDILLKRHTDGE